MRNIITATGRYNHNWFTDLLHNDRFMALCTGLPGWAGTRRNIHPVYSWSPSNHYQLLPSTVIHSILPVQFICLKSFYTNLCLSPLWSTSWSGALHLVFNTFLYPIWSMKWNWWTDLWNWINELHEMYDLIYERLWKILAVSFTVSRYHFKGVTIWILGCVTQNGGYAKYFLYLLSG